MTRPVVRDRPLAAGTWHYVCGAFPTEKQAAAAYQMLLRKTKRGEIGFYRHGERGRGGTNISAVSTDRNALERLARLLGHAGAHDLDIPRKLADAMITRRARIVIEAAQTGAPAGRIKIRHGGGAHLNPDGTMDEPGHGHG